MLRKLHRKWWFWLGLTGLVSVVLALGSFYYEWSTTRARGVERRDEVVRRLDAEDPNWRVADLCAVRNATIPPPGENAGERAWEAQRLIPKSFGAWSERYTWMSELMPGVQLSEEEFRRSTQEHADCQAALEVARTIRHLPQGGFPLDYKEPNPLATLLPHIQPVRETAGLLEFDALVLAQMNRGNDSIQSVHAIVNCARGLGDEPTLIAQLVRIATTSIAKNAAERTLGLTEPDAGLAELQAAFTDELPVPRLTCGFRGERASFYRICENVDEGRLGMEDLADGPGRGPGGLLERTGIFLVRKTIPAQQADGLELFGQLIAADRLSGPERTAAFDAIPIPTRSYENFFVALLTPAWHKVNAGEMLNRAKTGSAIAALACERYRRKSGKWPESLQAIPKDLLPKIPDDPYTGEPLLYAVFDDGVVIYATGKDLTDDGGTNLTSQGEPETDIGFRLFNPDMRRQPPPPRATEPAEFDPALFPGEPPPENEP